MQLWLEESSSGDQSAVMLKRFYDRTTRWMDETQKRWLESVLFLDNVNIRGLNRIIENEEEAKAAFHWFENEGSVRDNAADTFRVREFLRSRLLDYLRISDPDKFDLLTASRNQFSGQKQLQPRALWDV